jgi:hypothetical protein
LVWLIIPGLKLREVLSLRAEFPVILLESQLAFERVDLVQKGTDSSALEPALLRLEKHLNPRDTKYDFPGDFFSDELYWKKARRENLLKSIHQWELQDFIRSEGFGIGRGVRNGAIRESGARIEPTETIPFPSVVNKSRSGDSQFVVRYDKLHDRLPGQMLNQTRFENLHQYHQLGVFDFVDPIGWGWIPEKQKAAGFIPHAFHLNQPDTHHDSQKLQLKSLQLVTIDRFDEPRAFVLDHLPRMDEISGEAVPTRGLSEFEKRAIERLRTTEDIVIDDSEDPIRMVGSIRAVEDCLQCHTARRGELLGAFTYEFSKK